MTKLDGLGWSRRWVSHLGCLKGCLDYLGIETSDGWLFGATGHAFVLNIHDVICPSGPTAWKAEPIHRLGRNVGYVPEVVLAFKHQKGFHSRQELAWEKVQAAIDAGMPCFGWELAVPEYYVVYGYDDVGYLYAGPGRDDGAGPKAWSSLGDTGIGVLEMYVIRPGTPAEDATVVEQALRFAVDFGRDASPWSFDGYTAGLAGYDTWISALENGSADGFGAAYNAGVWYECRRYAVEFLSEAGQRLSPELCGLFQAAKERYGTVAKNLRVAAEALPFVHVCDSDGEAEDRAEAAMRASAADPSRRDCAIAALQSAREAEAAGLQTLASIADRLAH